MSIIRGLLFTYDIDNTDDLERETFIASKNVNYDFWRVLSQVHAFLMLPAEPLMTTKTIFCVQNYKGLNAATDQTRNPQITPIPNPLMNGAEMKFREDGTPFTLFPIKE